MSIDPETLLDSLYPDHPRLILKNDRFEALKQNAESDEILQRFVDETIRHADNALEKSILEYRIPDGLRLLGTSRDCMNRVYALGLAWRWTGEQKYADNLIENLRAVCAFPDWNPRHFLDTAEMTHAVGVAYDWLYGTLSETDRETMRNGMIEHGLTPGLKSYDGTENYGWWVRCDHNWNQVCNAGLIVGALAIAETHPEYAKKIIPQAVESFPRALKMYGPDGAWAEGPGYWSYATHYTMYGFTALETALNTDYDLLQIGGVSLAGLSPVYTTGSTGMYLNYADSGERARRHPMAAMFWLARTFNDPFVADAEHRLIAETGHVSPQHLAYYIPKPKGDIRQPALDKRFRGPVELALFRSAWNDPNALFIGVKAGYNRANHSHLDLGNFELDALGIRWARDLGSDNYNMPGYFSTQSERWQYYRLNSLSHNVPMLNGKHQDPAGTATLTRFEKDGDYPFAQIDLTNGYPNQAKSIARGVALVANRTAALVQDEFTLNENTDIAWGITTDAEITITDSTATLTQDGKELTARILSPSDATFTIESAEQDPPEKRNEGVKRLMIRLQNQQDQSRIAVLFSPTWEDGNSVQTWDVTPLNEWV
ncbi:MAG: heparinase II/III family protein [Candidatus Latescibacteria bacterium]|nr:heparinase II/III family protein [Candidatus Latescibacterota bacterium]